MSHVILSTDTLDRTDTFTIDMTEFEEAKPCEGKIGILVPRPCPKPAKWALWFSHHNVACPHTANYCEEHKDQLLKVYEHIVACPANHTCPRDKTSLMGKQLSEVFRSLEI